MDGRTRGGRRHKGDLTEMLDWRVIRNTILLLVVLALCVYELMHAIGFAVSIEP